MSATASRIKSTPTARVGGSRHSSALRTRPGGNLEASHTRPAIAATYATTIAGFNITTNCQGFTPTA